MRRRRKTTAQRAACWLLQQAGPVVVPSHHIAGVRALARIGAADINVVMPMVARANIETVKHTGD
jgi:hypothetical protein